MNTDFETPMAALFSRLQTQLSSNFPTMGRRLQHWTQVAEQPALFLRRTGASDEAQEPFTVTTLNCEVWIYCNAGADPDVAADATLTGLERLVRDCLSPDAAEDDGRQTLGGLVYWCRVEGEALSFAGDQGPQAVAKIHVRITLP